MTKPLTSMDQARLAVAERRLAAGRDQPRVGRFTPLTGVPVLYVTTTGRRSGLPREKWWILFAVDGDRLYLYEEVGTGADWVRNIQADPAVAVRAGDHSFTGRARVMGEAGEIERARRLLSGSLTSGSFVSDAELSHPGAVFVVIE